MWQQPHGDFTIFHMATCAILTARAFHLLAFQMYSGVAVPSGHNHVRASMVRILHQHNTQASQHSSDSRFAIELIFLAVSHRL